MSISIQLTSSELLQAAIIGSARRVQSMKDGYRTTKTSNWSTDIDAAAAEIAVSKAASVYWSGHTRNFTGPDVGTIAQVRHSLLDCAHLIFQERDEKREGDPPYILVTSEKDIFKILGWQTLSFAKANKNYWRPKDPNFGPTRWVPQEDLIPIDSREDLAVIVGYPYMRAALTGGC